MTQKNNTIQELNNKELSIQISLNGLSFCVLNTLTQTITNLKSFFQEKKQTPYSLLDSIKHLFNTEETLTGSFDKVTIIHKNELSTLVPKPLFNEDAIADYLKLNSKILKTDFITFDTITSNETVNVYVPYVNVNNFIYDRFGCFTYKHFSTVLIESILAMEKNANGAKLYLNINKAHFEIVTVKDGKLELYNTFEYNTPEDFIYYILFTIEQLDLNPETINVILLGDIAKNDTLHTIVYKYIRHVAFGNRMDTYTFINKPVTNHSNYTLLKSL